MIDLPVMLENVAARLAELEERANPSEFDAWRADIERRLADLEQRLEQIQAHN